MSAEVPAVRLLAHALALWVLLIVVAILVVDIDRAVFDPDEGALLMQAQVLAEEGTWFTPYPLADLDPQGNAIAIQHARFEDGHLAPSPVRPALVVATAVAWDLGGVTGATLLGISGVTAAVALASRIAGGIDPRATLVTFWLLGATSPLTFHALVLRGHGIAAGLTAIVMWLVVSEPDRRNWHPLLVPPTALVATLMATMIRREVALFALALAVVLGIRALRGRSLAMAGLAGAPLLGAAAGFLIDVRAMAHLFDGTRSLPIESGSSSVLADRVSSLVSLIQPGYTDDSTLAMGLIVATSAIAVAAVVRFTLRSDPVELLGGAGLAAVLLLARAVLTPTDMVPGIVAAFPLGVAALVLGTDHRHTDSRLSLLLHTFTVFVGLVVLTQYPNSGAWEWGNRFLAVGLVAALPVAGIGLVRTWDSLERNPMRHTALLFAGLMAVASITMGLLAQRDARVNNSANVAAARDLARATGSDLVVATNPAVPRTDTRQLDGEIRWLSTWPDELAPLLERLDTAGVDRVAFLSREPGIAEHYLQPLDWKITDLRSHPANPGSVYLGELQRSR